MDILQFEKRALKIRKKYKELEIKKYGKEWTKEQLVSGFKKDVSDLFDLIQTDAVDNKLMSHELSDCFWSVLILAKEYNIDIQHAFIETMNGLEAKIDAELHVDRK